MKKLFALILIMCLTSQFAGCAKKENPASDFEYSVHEDYVFIKNYIGESQTIVFPEKIEDKPVKIIGNAPISADKPVKKVIIPDTATKIGYKAFAGCKDLEEVIFGENLTEIMEYAFYGCSSLREVRLPKNLKAIGNAAFEGCTSLNKVYLPKNLSKMGMETFYMCPIEELILEDGIKTFGSYAAFWGAKFTELTVPASVEKIGEYSFHDNLEKVAFLGGCPECGKQPFGTKAKIYYKKGAKGWNDTVLREEYTLIEQ